MTDFAMTERDYHRLAEILDGFPSEDAMSLEELDGYLAALACAPEDVPPEEYFPELFCTVEEDVELFPDREGMQEFVDLVTRHFGTVMLRLARAEDFLPMLQEDEDGAITGNAWAQGFLRGMNMSEDGWSALVDDEQCAGLLVPIFALAYEHDSDPETRPFDKPVDEEQRELLLSGVSGAAPLIYEYFAATRTGDEDEDGDEEGEGDDADLWQGAPYRREGPKVGAMPLRFGQEVQALLRCEGLRHAPWVLPDPFQPCAACSGRTSARSSAISQTSPTAATTPALWTWCSMWPVPGHSLSREVRMS